MPTLIVFDLTTALVNTFTAAVPAGVDVFDGLGDEQPLGSFVMVGVEDPDSEDPSPSAAGELTWAGLGAHHAYEDGAITCIAYASTGSVGSTAQREAREAVRDIWAAIEAKIRLDPGLAGAVPGLEWVRPAGTFNLNQITASDGVAAVFRFEIAYKARL